MNMGVIITIVAYLGFMVCVGAYFSNKVSNSAEYFLGGRKLGPFVTAMSAEASDMSSWLLMGLPGVALACGLAEAFWTAFGLALGTYINWLIVARRIRIYTHEIDAVTIPEFFSKRFGDDKGILTLISSVVIVVFFIPYTASGFNACGTLFNTLSDGSIPYFTAMLLSAIVIIAYTTLGGFMAASTTDLIQSIVMTIALFVVVYFGINFAGGMENVINNGQNLPSFFELTSTYDYVNNTSRDYGFLTIVSTMAWGLGYFGTPHILLRFMAIKDSKKLKLSRRIATVWVVIAMGVSILIGVIGAAAVSNGTLSLDMANSQRIIVIIAKKISDSGLFYAILAGVILSGILASTMSTADSQLLAASSSISRDIMENVLKVKLSNKKSLLASRLTIILIAIVAIFWARNENSVFTIVSFAWAGFGASFGPVVLFALFWRKTNLQGALAGMISGGIMVFVWKYGIAKLGGVFAIYELLPAFIVGSIVLVVVSLTTAAPKKEILDSYDKVKKELQETK